VNTAIDVSAVRSREPKVPAVIAGAVSIVSILLLTYLQVVNGPPQIQIALQLLLLVAFSSLAITSFQAAVAIVILELIVFGSSGQWTILPGGIHGRIALYSIVIARAAGALALDWFHGDRTVLGRYGLHAVILAVALPGIWMTLGLLNGNEPRDVFADGNGYLFLAFALVFILSVRLGDAAWLRRWILFACAVNAVVIGAVVLVTVAGWVSIEPTMRYILTDRLLVGNSIGYLPNGAYRLYVASGMYLQVGIALVLVVLAEQPRRWWAWALLALLGLCEVATYTRGFWVGATIAFIMTVALVSPSLRRAAGLIAGTATMAVAVVILCLAAGFWLPGYLIERTDTIVPDIGVAAPSSPPGSVPIPTSRPGVDTSGEISSQVRVVQAQVLVAHIRERPLVGHGFGSIARDYPYSSIFSYELTYLDIAYKTGIIGLLLFLSFPVRIMIDAFRARFRGRMAPDPEPMSVAHVGVVPAIVLSVLFLGATNPYFNAAFGLLAFLIPLAWLERETPRSGLRRP
jgi:hypothetical protein